AGQLTFFNLFHGFRCAPPVATSLRPSGAALPHEHRLCGKGTGTPLAATPSSVTVAPAMSEPSQREPPTLHYRQPERRGPGAFDLILTTLAALVCLLCA